MKGIEKAVLGIMVLIIALIVVIAVFIIPMMNPQKQTNQEIDFRFYCLYWRQKQYQYPDPQLQTPDGAPIDMNKACTEELRLSCINYPYCLNSNSDWNKCIAACKLANATQSA
jgi:hypothetical protein